MIKNIIEYLRKVKSVLKYKLCGIPINQMIHVYGTRENPKFDFAQLHHTRQESTIEFIKSIIVEGIDINKLDFYIWTGDKSDDAEIYRRLLLRKHIFAYSTQDKYKNVIPIPDFIYTSWKEAGIERWELTTRSCMEEGKKPYDDDRLFWIGNASTHYTRKILLNISELYPDLVCAEGMKWLDVKKGEKQAASKYVSLQDHAKYKYLIDIQGIGYSGRLKLLFHLSRPVFIADRVHKEFYFDKLKDMENCIMVNENMDNLIDKLSLLSSNDELYKQIVSNANELVEKYLSKEYAKKYMRKCIEMYTD